MVQNTFSDCWPKPLDMNDPRLDKSTTKNWIQGNAIVSVIAMKDPGWSQIVFRRPTGVLVFYNKLDNPAQARNRRPETILFSPLSAHSTYKSEGNGIEYLLIIGPGLQLPVQPQNSSSKPSRSRSTSADVMKEIAKSNPSTPTDSPERITRGRSMSVAVADFTFEAPTDAMTPIFNDTHIIDPSFVLLQFAPYPSVAFSNLDESPHLIPSDDTSNRAISVLDRTPITDLHKIGLVYVGANQNMESQILANTSGSRLYTIFLCSLGQLFALSEAKHVYTGGLDTSPEQFDGPSALMFMHDQRMEQIIFHVTTLMPTRKNDVQCTGKKRHIGNDYVNIVWNESGHPYKHDTIPGQFNYVVIIIEPLADFNSKEYTSSKFRVSLSCLPDLIDLKTESSKLVMGSSLGAYTRQLAVQANMYCQIAASKETGYNSNSRERLRQIKRIKARIGLIDNANATTLDFTRNL